MPKIALKICFLAALIVSIPVSTHAQTGNPYFNVMDPAYGAKCDGSTDDTAAFQAALNAANAHGGTVFVPNTGTGSLCVIAGSLNMNNFHTVTLTGPQGLYSNIFVAFPLLAFTGNPASGSYISAHSSIGLTIQNIGIRYQNTSFTGEVIDLNGSSLATFRNMTVTGDGFAVNAACLICLQNGLIVTIDQVNFRKAQVAVRGAVSTSDFANQIIIRGSYFQNPDTDVTKTFSTFISGITNAALIEGNTFEMPAMKDNGSLWDGTTTAGCDGCAFIGNWVGDTVSSYTGPLFKNICIYPGGCGISITGNLFYGNGTSGSTLITFASNGTYFSITGNFIAGWGTVLNITGPSNQIFFSGNWVSGYTTFLSGTTPSSGMIVDPTGQTLIYGTSQFTGQAIFDGNVSVLGTLTKGGGSFKIDHPLDPANKYLLHSFVESPDMMNIYNGVVTLDSRGRAEVKLPSYFEALNQDFRYQLTPLGAFAPVYVSGKVKNNSFRIAGGRPGMEVSWQVTGIRHDVFANANRITVEEEKTPQEKGHYLYPALFGHSASDLIHFAPKPEEPKVSSDQPGHE